MKKVISFQQYLELFSECPSCHRPNEEEYIKKFYESKDNDDLIMKHKLIELLLSNKLGLNTKVGMLCCDCFRDKYSMGSGRPVYFEPSV